MARTFRSNLTRNSVHYGRVLVLAAGSAALVMATGCSWIQRATPSQSSSTRQQPKAAEAKVQQQHYDRGLQQYMAENYGEAKNSFLRVVENGPNTLLGMKAQENLKKIERILKTVEEIESK